MAKRLVLASSSPRRSGILREMGYDFEVVPPDFDEEKIRISDPEKLVMALAEGKAAEAAGRLESALVIGADTVVVFGGKMLGKPKTAEEAEKMLAGYSGKECLVLTGFCLMDSGTGEKACAVDKSELKMRAMTKKEIGDYVATGEPLERAGGFCIDGPYSVGSGAVESFKGSYSNILGFPKEKIGPLIEKMLKEK